MQPNSDTPTDRLAALVFPKLSTPASLENIRDARAQELENFFAPVIAYCDHQQADEYLSQEDFKHVFALRQAIDALLGYDEATEKLLTHYRDALTEGQRIAAQLVPSLDEALGLPPAPQPTGDRAAVPLYRLGWFRGYNLAQRQYEAVSQLYAKHASLPPPYAGA